MMDQMYRSLLASGAFQPGKRTLPLEYALTNDCTLPMLSHPEMAVDAVQVGFGEGCRGTGVVVIQMLVGSVECRLPRVGSY
jgi:hypothetical protein